MSSAKLFYFSPSISDPPVEIAGAKLEAKKSGELGETQRYTRANLP